MDAAEWGVEPGTPVLHGENWFFDGDGDVIEFGAFVTTGDRMRSSDYRVQ